MLLIDNENSNCCTKVRILNKKFIQMHSNPKAFDSEEKSVSRSRSTVQQQHGGSNSRLFVKSYKEESQKLT